jgi:hypothetical protein
MSSNSNSRRLGSLGRSGVTSLELALILAPFLWLMLGIFDLGRYFFTVQSMVTLMAEAERFAIVNPSAVAWPPCSRGNWSSVANATPLLDPAQVDVCIQAVNVGAVTQIQVQVTYPFSAMTPGLKSALDGPLTETTTYIY